MNGLDRLKSMHNKFSSKVTKSLSLYDYGVRYFYWQYYEEQKEIYDPAHQDYSKKHVLVPEANTNYTLKQFYISPKYDNIRDELTLNEVCHIGKEQVNVLVVKAKLLTDSNYAKSISCTRETAVECYEMKTGDPLSLNHVMVIMVYCNFDELSRKFSETYRLTSDHSTILEMKSKHRNFYWMGRYLREIVECFGVQGYNDKGWSWRLYHGVNTSLMFPCLDAHIKGPLSTSISYAVAVQFCDNAGMIVEFKTTHAGNFFFCAPFSDYPNEQEVFTVGGLSKFIFQSVFKPCGTNYAFYIKAIRKMTYCMGVGDANFHSDEVNVWDFKWDGKSPTGHYVCKESLFEKKLMFSLLLHQLFKIQPDHPNAKKFDGCPEYIDTLMDNHCKSIVYISFYVDDPPSKLASNVHDRLFKYDNKWIKLGLITSMFENVQQILYEPQDFTDLDFFKNDSIYNSVLEFLHSCNGDIKLQQILCSISPNISSAMMMFISKYQEHFTKYGWEIFIMEQDSKIISSSENILWKMKLCHLLVMKKSSSSLGERFIAPITTKL
eukprot:214926_1